MPDSSRGALGAEHGDLRREVDFTSNLPESKSPTHTSQVAKRVSLVVSERFQVLPISPRVEKEDKGIYFGT